MFDAAPWEIVCVYKTIQYDKFYQKKKEKQKRFYFHIFGIFICIFQKKDLFILFFYFIAFL